MNFTWGLIFYISASYRSSHSHVVRSEHPCQSQRSIISWGSIATPNTIILKLILLIYRNILFIISMNLLLLLCTIISCENISCLLIIFIFLLIFCIFSFLLYFWHYSQWVLLMHRTSTISDSNFHYLLYRWQEVLLITTGLFWIWTWWWLGKLVGVAIWTHRMLCMRENSCC